MKTLVSRRFAPFTLALTASIGGAFFVPAQAQTASNPLAIRTQKRVASLFQAAGKSARELDLSASQRSKLQSIARKNAPLAKAIWNDNSLTPKQKMSRLRAMQNETAAVFTPAQKQKLQSAKTGAMMQMFQTASWVSTELNLSAPQQERIQRIVLQSYRQGSGTAGSFGALRGLILDTSGQIDGVLTPAQRAKWNVIKGAARSEMVKNAKVWRQLSQV